MHLPDAPGEADGILIDMVAASSPEGPRTRVCIWDGMNVTFAGAQVKSSAIIQQLNGATYSQNLQDLMLGERMLHCTSRLALGKKNSPQILHRQEGHTTYMTHRGQCVLRLFT